MITDKAQRFQDFMQIITGDINKQDELLSAKNYTKKELQEFETELGKSFNCFHYIYIISYLISAYFSDKLKSKEGKLTEEEAKGKIFMQKERNNEAMQIERMHETDINILVDGLLNNEKLINEAKRVIEFYEKQNTIAKYIIKTKSNTDNNTLNDAFDRIDELRSQIRRRERIANSH